MIGKTTSGKEIELPLSSQNLIGMTELDMVEAFTVLFYADLQFRIDGNPEQSALCCREMENIEIHYGGQIQFRLIAQKYGLHSEPDFFRTGRKLAIKKVPRV